MSRPKNESKGIPNKQCVLQVCLSSEEGEKIKEQARLNRKTVSHFVRDILFGFTLDEKAGGNNGRTTKEN